MEHCRISIQPRTDFLMQHSCVSMQHSRSSMQHSRICMQHSRISMQHSRISMQHSRISVQHSRISVPHSRISVQHSRISMQHSRISMQHSRISVQHSRISVQHRPFLCSTVAFPCSRSGPYRPPYALVRSSCFHCFQTHPCILQQKSHRFGSVPPNTPNFKSYQIAHRRESGISQLHRNFRSPVQDMKLYY